jgi:SAM-dependent methyltransferase
MDFLELKNISEKGMDLLNPFSADKVLHIGQISGLSAGHRVIDFGCGFAEVLILWAEKFGISGVGVDIRPYACDRARAKITRRGLDNRLSVVCQDAAAYAFEPGTYDVAICFGATFIWEGFQGTLQNLKRAVRPGGQLVIGEAYWRHNQVPLEYTRREIFPTEFDILRMARAAGMTIQAVLRASEADWDRYVSAEWTGLFDWLETNPKHLDREQVIGHLNQIQEEYFEYIRAFLGWGVYILE